jgi:hypothetical protein
MYADFMFFNPETCLKYQIKTVETARDYLNAYVFRGGKLTDFNMDRNVLPIGFSGPVLIALTTISANVSRINADIRSILSVQGVPNSQIDETGTFVRNINKIATFDGIDSMQLSSPISDLAVRIDDTLRIEISESEVFITKVVGVDYITSVIKINPRPPINRNTSHTYLICGIKVVDAGRIGAINYVRGIATQGTFSIPESFNIDLYRTCYPEARLMTLEDAYASYVSYNAMLKFRVGNAKDFRHVSGLPQDSDTAAYLGEVTITKGLHVNSPTEFNGPTSFNGDIESSCNISASNIRTSNLEVIETTTLRNDLSVHGVSLFTSNIEIRGEVDITKRLNVNAPSKFNGPTSFHGEIESSCNIYASNIRTSNLEVIENTILRNDLSVDGVSLFHSNVEIRGTLDVLNDTYFRGLVNVNNEIIVNDNASFKDKVIFYGETEFLNTKFKKLDVEESLVLPSGSTIQRPLNSNVGSIRYNTDLMAFEGFTDTAAGWNSLGGIIDTDRDTYVSAELVPGSDDDTLRFYTGGLERMNIKGDGKISFFENTQFYSDSEFVNSKFTRVEVGETMVLPSGSTIQRPVNSNVGSIRYNTDLMAFEGFTDTVSGWNSLGGVIDTDRDTYISAEIVPGADDDNLRFYTGGMERINIEGSGPITFYGSYNVSGCDFAFDGSACFSNVNVSGNINLGNIGDLTTHLINTTDSIKKISADIDAPYVDDFTLVAIPGTNKIGATISIESAGDYKIYAFATSHDTAEIIEPEHFKHFYTKQVQCGNSNALYFNTGKGAIISSCGVNTETFSNIIFDKYFEGLEISSNNNPLTMGNYKAYRVQFMVENRNGDKVIQKRFSQTTPLSAIIRTLDIIPPTIATKYATAVTPTNPGGGRIEVFVSGISDNGIGAPNFDTGFGNFGAPQYNQGPGIECFAVALDRHQTFDGVEDAFAIIESGCNVTSSTYNYNPGSLYIDSYYTKLGNGLFSVQKNMLNFKSYSPHVLVQDKSTPPNRAFFRLSDTMTLDSLNPIFNGTITPFANHGINGPHEIEFEVNDIVDDTKTLLYAWLTKVEIIAEFATNSQAATFAKTHIPPLQTTPYEDREFMPILQYGNIRISGYYNLSGVYTNILENFTNYALHIVLIDNNNNSTYIKPKQIRTRDTIGPKITNSVINASQTILSPTSNMGIEIKNLQIYDDNNDFFVYFFCFSNLPPTVDVIKQRLRDGVYTTSHYITTSKLTKGSIHNLILVSSVGISTSSIPSIVPMTHGQVFYPVIFAIDVADRSDITLSNGNAVLFDTLHISRNTEPSGQKFVIIDAQPPQILSFSVSQGTLTASSTVPDSEVGHPYLRLSYNVTDRHDTKSCIYYTRSADVVNEILANSNSSANKILDPATYGQFMFKISTDEIIDVTAYKNGQTFDIVDPIIENERYYIFLATRDYHNNAVLYRPSPPYIDITPSNPVFVSLTFDVRNNKGDISPTFSDQKYILQTNYTSSYLNNNLSLLGIGQTVVFNDVVFTPLIISLYCPRSFVTKYVIQAGLQSQSPIDWTMELFDSDDIKITTDIRTDQTFNDYETKEFVTGPISGVSKAVLSIPVKVIRASTATIVNSYGLIQTVPQNTPRYDYDPITLELKGLLTEESSTNLVLNSTDLLINSWTKGRVSIETSMDYPLFETGHVFKCVSLTSGFRYIHRDDTIANYSSSLCWSAYFRIDKSRYVQMFSTLENDVFANYDIQTGEVGSKGNNVLSATTFLVRNDWYRCIMITKPGIPTGRFAISMIQSLTSVRNPNNLSLSTSFYIAAPQIEQGTFPTSYIPTNSVAVTRAKDIIRKDISLSMFRLYGGNNYNPLISNTLDITYIATDRGRTGLSNVYLYYSADDKGALTASNVKSNALTFGSVLPGSRDGGKTWICSRSNFDSQNFVSQTLPQTTPIFMYMVASDTANNFSSVVRDNLLSTKTFHNGLTYDTTDPVKVSLVANLNPRNELLKTNILDITFQASDQGGAKIAYMYVYYSNENMELTWNEVKKLSKSTALSGTKGGFTVDVSSLNSNSVSSGVLSSANLREWDKFWVYATCEDKDGNVSKENNGKGHKTEMVGNFNGDVGNITWDYSKPIGSMTIDMDIQNRLYFNITGSDTENFVNSGINSVYLYYTESNTEYSPEQTKNLALSTTLTSTSGGKTWDFTQTFPSTFNVNHLSVSLKEYSSFYSYVVIQDRQGNLSNTIKQTIPNSVHGGLTYDLTNPIVTVSDPVFTFPDSDIRNYRININFNVSNHSSGGSPFQKTYLYYTDTQGSYDATHVRLSSTNGGKFGSSNTDLSSGTFSISGSNISSMNSYVPWYFYITAFDTDTEIVRAIVPTHLPIVKQTRIPDSENGGKSYDLTPPIMSFQL